MRMSRTASPSSAALFHGYAALCWSTLQGLPGAPAARGPRRASRHLDLRPDNDGHLKLALTMRSVAAERQ